MLSIRSLFCARLGSRRSGTPLVLQVLLLIAASLSSGVGALNAQSKGIYQQGDAVVTGFSGVAQWKFPKDADPVEYQIINQQGLSLQIFALSQMFGTDDARRIPVERGFAVAAAQVGQVFGVALDDGKDAAGKVTAPNIYVTATSAFGLYILKETATNITRTNKGGVGVTWMQGQFGPDPDAGPGSVWKINGTNGVVELFTNISLDGILNSGPSLGNIAFDPASRNLFVSDRQTGMIHSYNLEGIEIDVFDHGTQGRRANRLPPVAFDPTGRMELNDPSFVSDDPTTWGLAPPERHVWGVAVRNKRLFYSVASGPEVWSIGIGSDGSFQNRARLEIQVDAPNGDPISDIAFDAEGSIFLAQRGLAQSDFDYTIMAEPERAALLTYKSKLKSDGTYDWEADPEEYPVGFVGDNRNTNGGVALGYGYYKDGFIRYDSCEATVWATGEMLRRNEEHRAKLGAPGIVHGLQGSKKLLVKPANVPPFQSYHIDYDELFDDDKFYGHMGDVAVWSKCGNAVGKTTATGSGTTAGTSTGAGKTAAKAATQAYPPGWTPRIPGLPDIRISKSCSPAAFAGRLECTVKLINVGDAAPKTSFGFTDFATPDFAAPGLGFPLLLLGATGSDPSWRCSPTPMTTLNCTIPGDKLQPGKEQSVNVIVDISTLIAQPGWQLTNTATLNPTGTTVTATVGDTLHLSKSAPAVCYENATCTFTIYLDNYSATTFSGNLKFNDDLFIGGLLAGGVKVQGVYPNHGCTVANANALPLEFECPVTIPAYGMKTFEVDMFINQSTAPGVGNKTARNCVIMTTPGLAPNSTPAGQPPSPILGAMLTAPNAIAAPGQVCVDFTIAPPNPVPLPPFVGFPPQIWPAPPGLGCSGYPNIVVSTANHNPGQPLVPGNTIQYVYTITNSTTCDLYAFRISESLHMNGPVQCGFPVNLMNPPPAHGDWFGILPTNDTVICTNMFTNTGQQAMTNTVRLDSRW